MFQFQLGAIGSHWMDGTISSEGLFQFQLGAIGSLVELELILSNIEVSIPAWCDWEYQRYSAGYVTTDVSIPAWCDWE